MWNMGDLLFNIVGLAVFLLCALGLSKFIEMEKKADSYDRTVLAQLFEAMNKNYRELRELVNEDASAMFIRYLNASENAYDRLPSPGSVEANFSVKE